MSDYLNNATVKNTLHVMEELVYEGCNNDINGNWSLTYEASLWIYRVLQHTDIRMMFFSGDTDGAVPTLGSQKWIKLLRWPLKEHWRPWFSPSKQVGGYIESYEHLDFVTVHGVGHMAPQWARQAVTYMVTTWMHGGKI